MIPLVLLELEVPQLFIGVVSGIPERIEIRVHHCAEFATAAGCGFNRDNPIVRGVLIEIEPRLHRNFALLANRHDKIVRLHLDDAAVQMDCLLECPIN